MRLKLQKELTARNSRFRLGCIQLKFADVPVLATSREVLTNIFVEELKSPARAFNCLKEAGIHAINDFLNYSRDDLGSISLRAMNLISLD